MSTTAKHVISYSVLSITIIILVVLLFKGCGQPQPGEVIVKTDTITKRVVDTLFVEKPKYITKQILDTIYIPADTALLVEEKTYEDSISTIVIEGVNPELKSVEYRIPRDSIFVNTETTIIKKKKYGAFVGVGAYCGVGMGYNYRNNSFGIQAPEVGIGLVVGFGRTW